jgi:hypothetical protein
MRKYWTKSEINEIGKLYANNYTIDIAKKFNVDVRKIYYIANLKGFKKSVEFLKIEMARQAERIKVAGSKYRYKPGSISHNKGKKMPSDIYQKCSKTMFKKGTTPHNTKFDGYERTTVDGYVEVRIKQGIFKLKHRLVYEAAYGAIPKNMYVIFKDKNKLNFDIDNLELVSRKEHMIRNSIQRFSKELKEIMFINSKLKRKINEKQN